MSSANGKTTIRDVARIAGVSYGTVSRYLNNSGHVSKQSARRIAAAIHQANYTPNSAARSLAQRMTHTIGFIIQVEYGDTLIQSTVAAAMAGANKTLGDAGYQMVVLIADTDESTARIAHLVHSDFADGYLLFSMSNDNLLASTFRNTGRPVVGSEISIGETLPYPVVDFTNEQGQYDITRLLIDSGRRRLCYVCGPGYSPAAVNRLAGFQNAMGDGYHPEHVFYADDWETTSGELAAAEFEGLLPSIDGIVCANDSIAVGAINQLNRMSYRVPDDIAVTGFDDSPLALITNPKLTTVRQDSRLHGETMARLLLTLQNARNSEGEIHSPAMVTTLPTTIIQRQSA